MDAALPTPTSIDRRKLAALVLAGAALAEGGIPVTALSPPFEGPRIEIDSLNRSVRGLTAMYDHLGPASVVRGVRQAEERVTAMIGGVALSKAQQREIVVLSGRLLALGARALQGIGRYGAAERAAKSAVRAATSGGDGATAGHALAMMSVTARVTGRARHAITLAHSAHGRATTGASAIHALLVDAQATALLPKVDRMAVLDIVRRAEAEHAKLPRDRWGDPGGLLGTYHPADVKLYGASALIDVGLFTEARPRLEDAAELLAGRDGLLGAYLSLQDARVSLGYGDLDEAHGFASSAMDALGGRSAAWAARIIGELERAAPGQFADLVDQTERWGLAAT